MTTDELLTLATPGTTLHIDLERGGAVEGDYVSHNQQGIVIQLNGNEQGYGHEQIANVYLLDVQD